MSVYEALQNHHSIRSYMDESVPEEKRNMIRQADQRTEGFTLKLALVDAVPVAEFSISMIAIASKFRSALFAVGACCSTLAGCGKVLWKILLAVKKKNVSWLNRQFRYLMSSGFVMMILSPVVNRNRIRIGNIVKRILRFPAAVFFAMGAVGMCAMGVMGAKLDKNNAKHNWIEQITNLISQGMIMIGILIS